MRRSKAVKTITDLTPKQKAFVDILVSNWGQMSKADAVRQAGYETKSPNGAHEIGSRLTNIETYIESEDNNGRKSSKDNES